MSNNLPKIALGAWAWGNDGTFGGNMTAETLRPIFDTAMANGLNLWDTAYAYGMGTSEKVLAGFLKDQPRGSYLVSDKFTPQCANGKPTAMADMIEMQLDLMGLDRFDIYWIHNVVDAPHWTEELAKVFEGRDDVPLLGVSNHILAEIRQAAEILDAADRPHDPLRALGQRLECVLADLWGWVFFGEAQEIDGESRILVAFGDFSRGACREPADVWEGAFEKLLELVLGAWRIFTSKLESAFALLMQQLFFRVVRHWSRFHSISSSIRCRSFRTRRGRED